MRARAKKQVNTDTVLLPYLDAQSLLPLKLGSQTFLFLSFPSFLHQSESPFMLGLPTNRNDGRGLWSPKKLMKRLAKEVMRSYKFRLPKYDLPLRLRPVCAYSSQEFSVLILYFLLKCSTCALTVVHRIYDGRHAYTGFPGLHERVTRCSHK